MGLPSQSLPTVGQPNSTEDVKIRNVLSELQTILTANVDSANLASNAVTTAKLTDASVTPAKRSAAITGSVSITGPTAMQASGTQIATASVTITGTGRPVLICVSGYVSNNSGVSQGIGVQVKNGATVIGQMNATMSNATNHNLAIACMELAPVAGSLTYGLYSAGAGDATTSISVSAVRFYVVEL